MMQLSPHFSLAELTFSQEALRIGIDNTPSDAVVTNLTMLCTTLLEPVRALLGVPLHVDSGYRSPIVNANVGGATSSAHLVGCAADCIPIGMNLLQAFNAVKASGMPFDQLILECDAWLHIGMAQPGAMPRGECLLASGRPGHWEYQPA